MLEVYWQKKTAGTPLLKNAIFEAQKGTPETQIWLRQKDLEAFGQERV